MYYQHLETIEPRTFNKANWTNNPFGVYFGFDIATENSTKNISIYHDVTGLVRPNPNGTGGLTNDTIAGGGVTPTGFTFITSDTFYLPILPNTSGTTRTDLVCIFFVERDTEPYAQLGVVILDDVQDIGDKRYIPFATLTVPDGFLTSDNVTVTKIDYKNNRKAAMTHMANTFLQSNTFTVPNYGSSNIFEKVNTVLNSNGDITIDISDNFYYVDEPTLTGIRGLHSATVTNVNNIQTVGKYRICHFQFNNTMALINNATFLSSETYILYAMGTATYLHDMEFNLFYLISTTQTNKFDDVVQNAQVDGSNLLVCSSFKQGYIVDASQISRIAGISFTCLTGVTKAQLNNIVGYSFVIAIQNASSTNPITLDTNLTSDSSRACFITPAIITQNVIVHCLVDNNGNILHDVKASEVTEDVSSLITSFPSPAIQPSTTEPVTATIINNTRVRITGLFELSANISGAGAVIMRIPSILKPPKIVTASGLCTDPAASVGTILIDELDVIMYFGNNLSSGGEIRVFAEYSLI